MKHALLYPIPKTAGEAEVGNLRPIALLEIGYKLATGLIAHRIALAAQTAPTKLIHHTLAGCQKDSTTLQPLAVWNSILEDAHEFNKPLWVCYADVEAAYDSVSTDSKLISFRRAGMPESFLDLIADLDIDTTTEVIVPGNGLAQPYTSFKGFRQGDPLSPLGWLIFSTPMVEWIAEGTTPHSDSPPLQHAPHPRLAQLNGTHTRDDSSPTRDAYKMEYEGPTITANFYMDDSAFAANSPNGAHHIT